MINADNIRILIEKIKIAKNHLGINCSKSYDYVPLPFLGFRFRFRANVIDRSRILPLLALSIVIKGFLNRYLKFYKKINPTLVTLITQVTVRFGNGP